MVKESSKHIIVSDDQKFIRTLEDESIDYLVPVENIKVFIREGDYKKLKKEMEAK